MQQFNGVWISDIAMTENTTRCAQRGLLPLDLEKCAVQPSARFSLYLIRHFHFHSRRVGNRVIRHFGRMHVWLPGRKFGIRRATDDENDGWQEQWMTTTIATTNKKISTMLVAVTRSEARSLGCKRLFGRTSDRVLQGIEIKDMGTDGKIFGYNSMSWASSSLKSLIEDSLSEDIPFPVPPLSWSLSASSVAYFLT